MMKGFLLALVVVLGVSAFGETNAVTRVSESPTREQCAAFTKSGTRCKRKAIPGGKLCRQHQKLVEKSQGKTE